MVAERVAQKADTAQAASPMPGQAKTELTALGEKIGRRLGEALQDLAERLPLLEPIHVDVLEFFEGPRLIIRPLNPPAIAKPNFTIHQ